jgi:hypothetical protein
LISPRRPTRDERPTSVPSPNEAWRRANLGLDESVHPKVATLALWSERFVQSALRELNNCGRWLIVSGPPRVGKSHAARCVERYYNLHRIHAWHAGWWGDVDSLGSVAPFVRWERICAMSRPAFEAEMDDLIASARLVVIDDIGSDGQGFKNDEEVVRLKRILDLCAREYPFPRRWLLATTNVPESQWEKRWDLRIAERLREGGRLSMFGVKPFRLANQPAE